MGAVSLLSTLIGPMEFVYVVPRAKLFPDCYPQGFVPFETEQDRESFEALVRSEGFYCERAYAEKSPDLKQVIPYTIFLVDGEVLVMRRLAKGGEARLHDKLSIGVGGHINPEDVETSGSPDPIRGGTQREIEEETLVKGTYELRTVGFLNDDSNPVGAVHVGVVQIAEITGTVEIREKDVLEGSFLTPAALSESLQRGDNFETWSSILIEKAASILPLIPAAPTTSGDSTNTTSSSDHVNA